MMSVEALAPPPQSSEQRATKTFYKSLRRRHTSWCQLKMTVLLGGNSHHLSKSGMWPDQRKKWSLYVLQHSVQAILAKQTSKSWLRKFSQCKCNLVVTSSVTVYPWVLIKYRTFSIQCLPIVNFIQFYSIWSLESPYTLDLTQKQLAVCFIKSNCLCDPQGTSSTTSGPLPTVSVPFPEERIRKRSEGGLVHILLNSSTTEH